MIVRQALAALGAFLLVDNVSVLPLGYCRNGTDKKAAAALDAVFGDFVCHAGFSLNL